MRTNWFGSIGSGSTPTALQTNESWRWPTSSSQRSRMSSIRRSIGTITATACWILSAKRRPARSFISRRPNGKNQTTARCLRLWRRALNKKGDKTVAAKRVDEHHADPMPFWSGTITFGLVSVPVDFFPAVRSHRVSLKMFGPDGKPLVRKFFSQDGKRLADNDIARGFEQDDGRIVIVTDSELDALEPRKSRDIDLRRFVQRDQIPPSMLERHYVLAPGGESSKAYHLLAKAMERGN